MTIKFYFYSIPVPCLIKLNLLPNKYNFRKCTISVNERLLQTITKWNNRKMHKRILFFAFEN